MYNTSLANRLRVRCTFAMVLCSVNVSVRWQRTDGTNITTISRIRRLDSGVRLQITELQRSDEEDYKCTGRNVVGSTDFTVKLLVHG